MGFFSKVFKGVGKVFKKIGKGIESAFKKFGRFMGKIGILGQVAMMFILPGIGNAILGTSAAGAAAAAQVAVQAGTATAAQIAIVSGTAQAVGSGLLGGALGSVGVAAGKAAVWVGNKIATVKNVFSNITQGVTETLGNFAKTAGKKLGFKGEMFTNAADNFFSSGTTGGETALSESFGSSSKFQNLTTDFSKVSKAIDDIEIESKIDSGSSNMQGMLDSTNEIIKNDFELPQGSSNMQGMLDSTNEIIKNDFELPQGSSNMQGMLDSANETIKNDFELPQGSSNMQEMLDSANEEISTSLLSKERPLTQKFVESTGGVFEGFGTKIKKGVQSQALQALGLENKPQAPIYNQYAAYVPSFDVAPQGTYGAPEIMGARDFEQQVTNNTSPYGYTAFQYQNYMAQFGQTA